MKRSKIKIMLSLGSIAKPLLYIMIPAVLMGVAGYLCAEFITILGGYAAVNILGFETDFSLKKILVILGIIAVLRGVLHYAEQYSNHYIAFKLLAILRDKVFGKLRELCPVKLECKDKGSLISVITSDIELLEVFYAHTISPIAIGIITSAIMAVFIGQYHFSLGIIAAAAYIFVGAVIPVIISKICGSAAEDFRRENGKLSGFVLETLYGISEIIRFGAGKKRISEMEDRTEKLSEKDRILKRNNGICSALTTVSVTVFPIIILSVSAVLYQKNIIGFDGVIIPTIAMFSSFGPVIALANLGGGLQQTFAAADRVLDILEEKPSVPEITGGAEIKFTGANANNVSFSYGDEKVLDGVSLDIPKSGIIGITGKSGSGKSTLLKLFMRFWETNSGRIFISGKNINSVKTNSLRDSESLVTQDTHIFKDTIENNLKIAKLDATRNEIETACKKASIHDFIMSLPSGYETQAGELGDMLSGGEKQRIGAARAFLHDSEFMLFDEPTSNLDALNEAVILKSISEQKDKKAILLVSHRASTMRIADKVFSVENGRKS
ncbi:MAG: amino acid ABC transporter ATP-binding/permease protein [Oscillospiraceae bacterium]